MRAHLIQMDIAWEEPEANYEKVRQLVRAAAPDPGDLVLLPEMFDTGFSMNISRTADSGATFDFVRGLSGEFDLTIQAGRTVAGAHAKALNQAFVVSRGVPLATYAKIHLFSVGREHDAIEHGSDIAAYDWRSGDRSLRVCPAICYDLRFPELFRRGLVAGAELFALGACWLEARHSHWRALLIARAIENQALVLGVNRTGTDPNARYLGGSIVIDPTGMVLGELDAAEGVLSVDIDPAAVARSREKFPAWRDHRLLVARSPLARGAATAC